MEDVERIKKDIEMFEKNMTEFLPSNEREGRVLDLARSYYQDAKYYLKKGDSFTSFGCINYAHGLLDALIKLK